jgi:hypothetical protein
MLRKESKEHELPQPFLAPDDLDHLRLQGGPVPPEVGFEVPSAIRLEELFLTTVLTPPFSSLEDLSTQLKFPDAAAA